MDDLIETLCHFPGELMADEKNQFVINTLDKPFNDALAVLVDIGERFIEDENGRITQKGTGKRDSASFATG